MGGFNKKLFSYIATVSALLLCSTMVSAQDISIHSQSTPKNKGIVSVAEYDDGVATLSGYVPVSDSQITIEVLDENSSFNDVTDRKTINNALSHLLYLKQIKTDENGYYNVSWNFKGTREGVYPVKIYSLSDDKAYESNIKIGESNIEVDSINHWYESERGVSGDISANSLAVQVELSETSGKADKAAVIIAEYDKSENKLVGVNYNNAKIYGNAKTLIKTNAELLPDANYIKVFVWDNINGMHPLGDCSEFYTTVIVPPTGEKIYNDMVAKLGGDNVHPRIVASESDFDNVKDKIANNSVMSAEYTQFKRMANSFLNDIDVSYDWTTDYSILDMARRFKDYMMYFGMMYKITGDEAWANAMWHQVDIVSNEFPDWNPYHFLDTAEIAYGYAIAYDWLYDWLTDEQKALMARTINEKAFAPIMEDYLEVINRQRTFQWSLEKNTNNWNLVCNGGVMCAALAFMDNPDVSENAKTVLSYGMKNLTYGMELYEKDGDWEEGVTYWCYASLYLAKLMTSLDNTAGTKYNYADMGGVEKSFDFVLAMQGSTNPFNFHETEDNIKNQGSTYWFAHEYNNSKAMTYIRKVLMNNSVFSDIWELLWYDGSCETGQVEYPMDYIGSKIGTVTMRSGSKKTDTYVGFHNGKNDISHSQFDEGTFIIDSQGQRFIKDLGKDNYDLTPKFGVYRNRAEGHNTLVINPSASNDQISTANCMITEHKFGDTSYAISNLTSAYADFAKSINRGVMLTDNRQVIRVRDEISLKKSSELYWFAHTDARITLSGDKKSAILRLNGKYMIAKILEGDDAEFSVMNPEPLSSSPKIDGQAKNTGSKLAIHLTEFTDGAIEVGFAPISSAMGDYEFSSIGTLENWSNVE